MTDPTPYARSTCPDCQGELISKCGEINIWHWAHASGEDCDTWHEPETAWHRHWKARLIDYFTGLNLDAVPEATLRKPGVYHRADIYIPSKKLTIELQHSPISTLEIREREAFYGNMVWIFDYTEIYRQKRLVEQHGLKPWTHKKRSTSELLYLAKYHKKSLDVCKKPVFLHVGFTYQHSEPICLLVKNWPDQYSRFIGAVPHHSINSMLQNPDEIPYDPINPMRRKKVRNIGWTPF